MGRRADKRKEKKRRGKNNESDKKERLKMMRREARIAARRITSAHTPSPIPPFCLPQVYPSSFSRRLCFAQYA